MKLLVNLLGKLAERNPLFRKIIRAYFLEERIPQPYRFQSLKTRKIIQINIKFTLIYIILFKTNMAVLISVAVQSKA